MFKAIYNNPSKAVFTSFFIYSFALGMLFPRLADLQIKLDMGEATLGMALLGLPIGLQISLLMADRILKFLSLFHVMVGGVLLMNGAFVLAALAPSPIYFFAALLFGGLSIGVMEVAVNLEADRVEYQIGHRIMNRAHGFWSLGFCFTGIVGAAMSQWAISPFSHFVICGGLSVLASFLFFARYQQAKPRPSDAAQTPLFVRPTKSVMVLVYLTLSAMLVEGSAIDWSVIYMRDIFNTLPLISGLALALAAFSQFFIRYFADIFVDKYGPVFIARFCIWVMLISVLMVSLAPHPVLALIGFAGLGAGSSVIFPLSMSAAAQQTDRPAAVNVASLAQIAFVVFLLAPPILGFIAEYLGIRYSFAIALPFIMLSFFNVKGLAKSSA